MLAKAVRQKFSRCKICTYCGWWKNTRDDENKQFITQWEWNNALSIEQYQKKMLILQCVFGIKYGYII
jgi:hypothetical protein